MEVRRLFAVPAVVAAFAPFHALIQPLSGAPRAEVRRSAWHAGCPVALSDLRLLTVSYIGFDGNVNSGQLVVNRSAAAPLARVFRQLYRLRFHIHHMSLSDAYGPAGMQPAGGDVSSAFDCRQAVPSPCVGGSGTGTWSEHAFGEAVDLNPVENPYVGCGQTRNPASRPYFNRSRHRPGMVTVAVIRAFRSIGWGWGGSWSGSTKDYMHFSATGH
jgi:D-alanyl-D-alanine carboxypeptidase